MTKTEYAVIVIWLTVLSALVVALFVLTILAVIQTSLPEVTRTVDAYWNVVCYHGHNWGQCLPLNTLGVDY